MESYLVQLGVPVIWVGDVVFFALLAIIGMGLGFFLGRYRLLSFSLGMYLAFVMFQVIPQEILPNGEYISFIFFLILVTVFTVFDYRLFDVGASDITRTMWKSILFGVASVGMFMEMAVMFLPYRVLVTFFSSHSISYFTGTYSGLIWLGAPLLLLLLVRR